MTAQAASPSFRRNAVWTIGGNVVYAACQWGMLVVLAKLGSLEKVGQLGYALAITAPIVQLAGLNLRAIQSTDARREYSPGQVLALRLAMLAAAAVALTAIATGAPIPAETALVVLGVGAAKIVESVSDVFYGVLQQRERMAPIARSLMLRGVTGFVGLALGVAATGRVVWGVVGYAAAWAGILLFYDLPCAARALKGEGGSRHDLAPHGPVARLGGLAKLAAPLGIVMALISFNTAIPRYFLEHTAGEAAVGVFSALASLILAGTLVVGALGASASPRLARLHAEGDLLGFRRFLGRLALGGAAIGATGVAAVAIAGDPILRIVYTPEYATYAADLVWIMVAGALGYVSAFLGYGLTAARILKPQIGLFAAVALACALASAWFVPVHGVRGAAWALLAGYAVQLVGSAWLCRVGLTSISAPVASRAID